MIDLEPVTEQMAAIVGNIGEEQLAGPRRWSGRTSRICWPTCSG